MASFDKEILCIQKEILFRDSKWGGFVKDSNNEIYNKLLKKSEFRLRAELETDSTFLQIIPQVIVKYNNTYFLHRQVKANEARLNSLCPLFFGGHVSEADLDKNSDVDYIQQALARELSEEVSIKADVITKTYLGTLYLDDNEVNKVHIGVAYMYEIDSPTVDTIETQGDTVLESLGWKSLDWLKEHREELTYWSSVIIDYIEA